MNHREWNYEICSARNRYNDLVRSIRRVYVTAVLGVSIEISCGEPDEHGRPSISVYPVGPLKESIPFSTRLPPEVWDAWEIVSKTAAAWINGGIDELPPSETTIVMDGELRSTVKEDSSEDRK